MIDGTVRRLRVGDDLTACMDLANDRGWAREEHKWRLLFDVGHVYGLDDPDGGGLAGTVVSTPYGRDVAAISMMLVANRYERRGIGGRLMRHALERSGTASACLTATEYGRGLYERLGFRGVGRCSSYSGVIGAVERPDASRPVAEEDLPDVIALDAEVFGARRDDLMRRLPAFSTGFRVVRDGGGALAGFGGTWDKDTHIMVGPVVARDPDTARALVADLVPTGVPVRFDLDHRHPGLIAWVTGQGLVNAFDTTLMEYGEPVGGDPSRLFLPVMQALG